MTNEQYEKILEVLTDKIKEQETVIFLKDYKISELESALAKATGKEVAEVAKNVEPF